MDVRTTQIQEEIAAVIQLIPQERVSERIIEQTRHSACIPLGTYAACSGHPFPSLKVGFTARTQGAFSQRRRVENPHVQLQRVSSEDCRTQVCGQAVKQSAGMRSALHAPIDVVGEVPVRSCREYHQKTTEHQFVDRQ